jgi:hypothetical protein
MGLSNAFSILTTIILLHAIDTRSSLHETRRKIEDGSLKKDPISAGSTAVTHSLLRRRMLIAATMVSFAWFAFLANIILVCVDDRLAETDYMTSQATDSIANSPYYTYRGSVPPGMTAELDWYWGPVLDGSASSSSSLLPDLIRQDMSILFPLSAVRGISLICCWALGLVEIKLRSAPKRSPKLVA